MGGGAAPARPGRIAQPRQAAGRGRRVAVVPFRAPATFAAGRARTGCGTG